MLTIAAFIVTIGIIVTIHEYGHFQVARWCGVRVLRFSIGFGKPIFRKVLGKDQTEFVISLIPLGGFVKMLDEREFEAHSPLEASAGKSHYTEAELTRAFNRQSVYKRMLIVLAGPTANLLLAVALYWLLLMQGITEIKPVVGPVRADSAAAQASFTKGELIQKIGDQAVDTWSDVRWKLLEASFKQKSIQVDAISEANELHQHELSLSQINQDAEIDILDKLGLSMFRPDTPAIIGKVLPDSVALQAGLRENDKIITVDSRNINNWDELVNVVELSAGKKLKLKVERDRQMLTINITPKAVSEHNQLLGKIGAAARVDQAVLDQFLVEKKYPAWVSLKMAGVKTWETSIFSLKMLWYMVSGKTSWKGISGPVTIASYAGESADLGLKAFIGFIALVSISIGVLNLLPIPVLDGGHLMYYMAEIIKGSPVSDQAMIVGQKIGFVLLGLLMTIAIFNDINRIFLG